MRKGILYTALGALALGIMGCHGTIHEHPGPVTPDEPLELIVEFHADRSAPEPYVDIVYSSGGQVTKTYRSGANPATRNADCFNENDHLLRFIVELYEGTAEELQNNSATLLIREVLFAEINQAMPQHTASYEVEPGNYTVVSWSDYVEKTSTLDLYYNCTALYGILYSENAITDNDTKDAYTGIKEVRVSAGQVQTRAVVDMIRPFGRYRILGTDFDFLRSTGRNIEDLQIELRYKQYVSSGYNAFQQIPNRFVESRTFRSRPEPVTEEDGELALLGYDYIFVNGTESNVLVDMYIYDANDQLLVRSTDITIPIVRNKETTVRGEFVTTNFGNDGMGVDERFEGEIVIPIN